MVGVRAVEEVQLARRVCLNACILRNKVSLLEVTEQRDGRKPIVVLIRVTRRNAVAIDLDRSPVEALTDHLAYGAVDQPDKTLVFRSVLAHGCAVPAMRKAEARSEPADLAANLSRPGYARQLRFDSAGVTCAELHSRTHVGVNWTRTRVSLTSLMTGMAIAIFRSGLLKT